jgi:hypothetical protein
VASTAALLVDGRNEVAERSFLSSSDVLQRNQKASSRCTLVLCVPTLTVLLKTCDFPRGSLDRLGIDFSERRVDWPTTVG